jgi:hypothetical protein
MRSQMTKGLTMLALIVTLATAAAVANGQTAQRVTAQVPFDFIVGDQTISAGACEVKGFTNGGAALIIQNAESRTSAVRLTNSVSKLNDSKPRLVFHRYGETYFLAEVWTGDSSGRRLLQSKRERSLKQELSKMARNNYEAIELVAMVR